MQPPERSHQRLDDETFRAAMAAVVARSRRSFRSLSLAIGRDPGYLAALLDPGRPSRARPTPDDLVLLSDATGIALVELLETLWGIPRTRLADELTRGGTGHDADAANDLAPADRALLDEFAAFLVGRRGARTR